MLISYNWLKDYVDVKIAPEKLAELLTMSGLTVASIEKTSNDHILDIEVTSNRPDWLSYIGVARELAAISGEKLKVPVISDRVKGQASRIKAAVKIDDKKLCPRYTARIISNVKVGESPAWLKTKIEAMGLRSVNNIVDITNFCLFETGEPMHAFDLDKISGQEIVVRKAKKGEKISAIDGIERTLDDSNLVIADKDRAVAIAGVMGGLNTEVTGSTKNILLEAASFDPISIRRTSRKLGISTDSSYRFERRIDIENIIYSSNRAVGLILELAGGEPGELVDVGAKEEDKRIIDLRYARLNKILGVEIPKTKVESILNALGLVTKASTNEGLKLEVPHCRHDIEKEIDLIEEVSRIYGYDKIPLTIPNIIDQPVRRQLEGIVKARTRQALTGLGLDEILTYSLLSKKFLGMAGLDGKNIVEIKNPLSIEQEVMRPSLLIGLFNSILWNLNRKIKDIKFFELGNIYEKEGEDKFAEKLTLSIGLAGQISIGWAGGSRPAGFFDLKGIVETLFSELGIINYSFKDVKDERFSAAARALIEINGEAAGVMGAAASKILNGFDIKDKVYAAEIYIDQIMKHVKLEKRFNELPKYPSVFRDISIIVGKEASNEEILALIKKAGGPILKEAKLIDRYIGKQIPEGKASLTYRLEYQDPKKTLEDKDVQAAHSKILETIDSRLGTKHR
jgi:phenylalanyl-tRNA synthetase beta chain